MAEPCRLPSCYFPASRHARVEGATAEENIQPEAEGGNVSSTVSLPDDILFEVLSRLPVKPLCRLRCVSKAWRALISDPAFAAAQSSRAAAAGRPLVVGTFGEPLKVNLRVIDTADGSVVRVVEDVGRSTHRCDPWLAPTRLRLLFVDHGLYGGKVIDPVTGRVTTVAGLKALDDEVNSFEYCHSFLGRAAAPSGAYKIMRVHKNWVGPPEKLQSIEVATLGDTAAATSGEQPTWRQRPVPPFHIVANSRAATVDDDGVIHFMEAEVDVTPTARMRIAAFDLESEEWKAVIYGPPAACPGQEGGTTEAWDVALAELKGALSVVQNVELGRNIFAYINIWRLVDAAQSIWVKECTIQMDESCIACTPLEVFQDGRVMLSSCFMKQPTEPSILQLYNSSTGAVTDAMEMPHGFLLRQITLYTGSLLC
jgi:hypothetical protein